MDGGEAIVSRALAEGRTGLALQPVIRAGEAGRPAFHEALSRIYDAQGNPIAAAAFLPKLSNATLRKVDLAALEAAVALLVQDPSLRLSVNVSPRTLVDADWAESLVGWTGGRVDVCGRLIVEITEDAVMHDIGAVREVMAPLRRLGVAFALDDFGDGATAFKHLRDLRFDLVKIGGGYTRAIERDMDARVLIDALIGIAGHFGMFSVAEAVERPSQAETLVDLGIDCLQGFLYGRPRTAPRAAPVAASGAG